MTSASTPAGSRFRLHVSESAAGEPLCLALANTSARRRGADPGETLVHYADAVELARGLALLDDAAAARLHALAARTPRVAQVELDALIALRGAMHRAFSARAAGMPIVDTDLAVVMGSFDAALDAMTVEVSAGALVPRPRDAGAGLAELRLQAALSAVALLAGDAALRVRECADAQACGRLFVDTTRNRSRRYCLAGACGNRARQAAFRARRRDVPAATQAG